CASISSACCLTASATRSTVRVRCSARRSWPDTSDESPAAASTPTPSKATTVDFDLSESECALRDAARSFSDAEAAPRAAAADAAGALDPTLVRALGAEGYLGLL